MNAIEKTESRTAFVQLLDAEKNRLGLKSDLQMAKRLDINYQQLIRIRGGSKNPGKNYWHKLKSLGSAQAQHPSNDEIALPPHILDKLKAHARRLKIPLNDVLYQACIEFIEKRAKTTCDLESLPAHSLNEPSPAEQRKEAEASGNVIDRKTILGA